MSLSAGEIGRVLEEVSPWCQGALVSRVRHRGRWELLLELRKNRAQQTLAISIHPRAGRLYLTGRAPGSGEDPPGFVQLLRARIEGLRIASLEQVAGDRVILLEFSPPGDEELQYLLAAEITGKSGNIFLMDSERRKIGVMDRAKRQEESVWEPPAQGKGKGRPTRDFAEESGRSYAQRMEAFYEKFLAEEDEKQRYSALRHAAKRELNRLSRLCRNLERDLSAAREELAAREIGELIKANIVRIPQGAKAAILSSFDDPGRSIQVVLDPSKTAGANADAYFGRARRAQRAIKSIEERLAGIRREEENIRGFLGAADAGKPLEQLERDAVGLNLLKRSSSELTEGSDGDPRDKGKVRMSRALESLGIRPRAFESPSGVTVYVGRNDKENDLLTTRFARPHDYFFHVSGAPGSHVLACLDKGRPLDPATLHYAARLALNYSTLGKSGRGEVTVTEKRYVRKRRGDPPGAVHIVGPRKTVWVDSGDDPGHEK